jgi:hypothetical protein
MMKQSKPLILLLFLWLVACTPSTEVTKTPTTETISPTDPAPTATIAPVDTPISGPATSLETWAFYELSDPTQPSLLINNENGLSVDPTWQLSTIEYVDQWWGLGEPGLDIQRIERASESEEFVKGNQLVDITAVQTLLDSLTHLYPTDSLLGGNAWTDDYPSWTIELTGLDGQRILMFASSTGNIGHGPWVFLINGQLYAQYNGAVAKPLGQLFETRLGDDEDVFDYPKDMITFETRGWPGQMQGFYGLLPIADSFRYGANWGEGTLTGQIQGRNSIGGFGMMVIGTIDHLKQVEIHPTAGEPIACTIEDIANIENDPAAAAWEFSCPIANLTEGASYHYNIVVEFGTDSGSSVTTTGQLWGVWHSERSRPRLHAPSQIEEAFLAHDTAQLIWNTHHALGFNYSANINPNNPNEGTWSGEVVFAGEAELVGQTIRYTIGTPFAIENGVLTYWHLTPRAIQDMLTEIEPTPLLTQAVNLDPNLMINLWYEEKGNQPEVENWLGNYQPDFEVTVYSCGSLPSYASPNNDEPLRAFSLNSYWFFWQPEFILTKEGVRVAEIDLFPYQTDEGGLLPLLQPDLLDTGDTPPFERIWWQSKGIRSSQPELTLWIPEDADAAALETYNTIVNNLPVPISKEYDTLWTASNLGFYLTEDGLIDIMSCH